MLVDGRAQRGGDIGSYGTMPASAGGNGGRSGAVNGLRCGHYARSRVTVY